MIVTTAVTTRCSAGSHNALSSANDAEGVGFEPHDGCNPIAVFKPEWCLSGVVRLVLCMAVTCGFGPGCGLGCVRVSGWCRGVC
jgi:hypothetical protein